MSHEQVQIFQWQHVLALEFEFYTHVGKVQFELIVSTYNYVTTLIEDRWASSVDAAYVFLPTTNAFCDVSLVAPHSLRVREVKSTY